MADEQWVTAQGQDFPQPYSESPATWLALAIGNSRYHWAEFVGDALCQTWDTPHPLEIGAFNEFRGLDHLPTLWIASVVPEQSQLWATYPNVRFVTLKDIPLAGLYPTLGIDRALALWGAIAQYGGPVLVIDGGTALTFTGADGEPRLVGGAILPGLRLQFQALQRGTAALPWVDLPDPLPPRWATDTESAIASGILYTAIAGIQAYIHAWLEQFPNSSIVLTGGDGEYLARHLASSSNPPIHWEPNLIFCGIQGVRYR